MIIAILILTFFNTGLLILLIGGATVYRTEILKSTNAQTDVLEQDIEALGTALYNMDSIKQKVEMTGRCEL